MLFILPYRLGRNRNSGGVMIFVKEDILRSLLTKHNFPSDFGGLFDEIHFRKSECLLFGTCNPSAQNDQYLFNCIDKVLDTYNNYDNILLTGDFNAEGDELFLSIFLYQHYLFNLVRVGTCSRNSSKPTSVDLFLTSKITHFQNIVAVCSGLSDFHKLVLTVLKTSFDKKNPVKF